MVSAAKSQVCATLYQRGRCLRYHAYLVAIILSWESALVQRSCLLLAFAAAAFTPVVASAAMVAANSIPDGTYTVKVVKVVDPKHVDVTLNNGQEAVLPAGRAYVDFSKVQPNDQIELSLIGGNVMVYKDLTSH